MDLSDKDKRSDILLDDDDVCFILAVLIKN